MLRAIAYLVAVFVLTLFYGVRAIVAAFLGVKNRPGGLYDRTGRVWARLLLKVAGVKVGTEGFANIPRDQLVVYVSNHQSFFDILALLAVLPDTFRFVAKKELAKIPVFGRALRAAGHIYIDRQRRQAAFESYERAAAVIQGGTSAMVFVEGTRSRTGELLPFKKGPFVLAVAAQVPIVPVYCAHTFHILPKGHFRIRPRPVTLYFGEPIPTAGLDYEDRTRLLNQARSVIEGFRDDALRRSPQVEG
ncbi:MAG: 1-acyl-sn-glycerol-3-phosphate acyltransferase [Gemmatimonadota bacterium]|nr:MAG: 1-acyl-sn-glycerol-3-phosphate acyltransferase [Gemmatimonadota bacterium]